jgi:hypothetical protein
VTIPRSAKKHVSAFKSRHPSTPADGEKFANTRVATDLARNLEDGRAVTRRKYARMAADGGTNEVQLVDALDTESRTERLIDVHDGRFFDN